MLFYGVACLTAVLLLLSVIPEKSYSYMGMSTVGIQLKVTHDYNEPDPNDPLHIVSSDPENHGTLPELRDNEISLYFNRDIEIPDTAHAAQVLRERPPVSIMSLTTGRRIRSRHFRFTVLKDESGNPVVLRIRENGAVFLRQRRLPGRPNRDGHWFLITPTEFLTDTEGRPAAPFKLYLCTLIGDFNGSGEVEEPERSFAEREWGRDYHLVEKNMGWTIPPKPIAYAEDIRSKSDDTGFRF